MKLYSEMWSQYIISSTTYKCQELCKMFLLHFWKFWYCSSQSMAQIKDTLFLWYTFMWHKQWLWLHVLYWSPVWTGKTFTSVSCFISLHCNSLRSKNVNYFALSIPCKTDIKTTTDYRTEQNKLVDYLAIESECIFC